MDTRLPKENLSLVEREVNTSGLRLLTIALGGLLVAVGGGSVLLVNFGVNAGVTGFSSALLLTALFLFIALRQFDLPDSHVELGDRVLIGALMSLNRRAALITDLNGARVESNEAFARLRLPKGRSGLLDMVSGDDDIAAMNGLIGDVRRKGEGRGKFALLGDRTQRITIEGRRTGAFILWSISIENQEGRMKREAAMVREWAAPIMEKLEMGLVLEGQTGEILYVNSMIRSWMGLSSDDEMPSYIPLDEEAQTLSSGRGQSMDVDIIDIPLTTRGNSDYLGRYRFVRAANKPTLLPGIVNAENLMGPLIDAAPLNTVVIDENNLVREFNLALGQHPAGRTIAVGADILSIIHREDRKSVENALQKVRSGVRDLPALDIKYNCQPEREGRVYFSTVLLNNEFVIVLYLADKTQEKSFERQFVQAQKMQAVGQLAGGVAHDFNNLLTAILGFCDLLLVRHDAGDQSFSDLIQIKQNANRASNLVRQLLAFSRQQTLRPKVLMVTDVIAELSSLLRRLIGENIDLKVTHGRNLMPVKVDQGQLDQVIINLAVNARDAMPDGGSLEIRTSHIDPHDPLVSKYELLEPADYIMIEVIDSGCGIEKDNLTKIFEPFFTTKAVGQGTGLGLATVYGIVKQTGGFVFVESEEGAGTTFMILLKVHDTDEEEPVEEEAAPTRDLTGKGTVLIVEDEDPVRMFAARALSNKGYAVLEAASGESGLEILQSQDTKVDLLISDVIMPNMDGPTLVKEARKLYPALPVIFISGYAEDMLRENLAAEEFAFLPKPFSLKDLAENVKSILG